MIFVNGEIIYYHRYKSNRRKVFGGREIIDYHFGSLAKGSVKNNYSIGLMVPSHAITRKLMPVNNLLISYDWICVSDVNLIEYSSKINTTKSKEHRKFLF